MDDRSREILHLTKRDHASIRELCLSADIESERRFSDRFKSSRGRDYSKLGAYIGENTHLTTLMVCTRGFDFESIPFPSREFAGGLKRNSSIHELQLHLDNTNIVDVMAIREILNAYQENNGHLTHLTLTQAHLENGGDRLIANTLRRCTNLKHLDLQHSNVSDEQLLPIIEAIREHTLLEMLYLDTNRIGNAGCGAIATLLGDTNCYLHTLGLWNNSIGYEGATALANGLARNNTLRKLYLDSNVVSDRSVEDIFSRVLCDTSSVSSIYSSNHTLEEVKLPPPSFRRRIGEQLAALLKLNTARNKSHVAIKKILTYHPNINMEPLFEWNMEGERERNLKALPYVIAWFERAGEAVANEELKALPSLPSWFDRAGGAVANEEGRESYNLDQRRLDTIYQFACAMPLLFVPASHIKEGNNKRKRGEN